MYAAHRPETPALRGARRLDSADTIPVFDRALGSWRLSLHRQAMGNDELVAAYDRAAPRWRGTLARLDYPRAYEALLDHVLRHRPPRTDSTPLRVLDCGAGTGELSRAMSRVTDVPIKLDLIDISTGMLEQARCVLRDEGIDAAFHHGDARELPFDDDVFDVTMSAHVLEHLPDPRSALTEMVRVTRPGGLVIACLTRRSALGLCIHFKWRIHMVSARQVERWMRDCGLSDAGRVTAQASDSFHRRSVACAGTKR